MDGQLYEVRIQLREQGVDGQWFEREFIWHADLAIKRVSAASLPADGLTPKEPDSRAGCCKGRAVPSPVVYLLQCARSFPLRLPGPMLIPIIHLHIRGYFQLSSSATRN